MTEDKTYNGWKNYETWCVHLWMSNEQGTDTHCCDLARETLANLQSDWDPCEQREPLEEIAARQIGERIQDYVENLVDEILQGPASFVSDLVNASLSEVDWTDIGAAYFDAVEGVEA